LAGEAQGVGCARCGACLSVCPVYDIVRQERYAPRGKQTLLARILFDEPGEGQQALSRAKPLPRGVLETLGACLQCGACSSVCSAGVQVSALVRDVRGRHPAGGSPPGLWEAIGGPRIFAKLIPPVAGVAVSIGLVERLYGLYRQSLGSGGKSVFRVPPISPRPALSAKGLKRLYRRALTGPDKGHGGAKGPRIAFFLGCVQNYLYPEVAESMAGWLEGDIVVPSGQGCCGMAAFSDGALDAARVLARQNIEVMEAADADFIVTGCASCASMLIYQWPFLFHENEREREAALRLAAKTREFSALVMELGRLPEIPQLPKGTSVTYHVPCHQRYQMGTEAVTTALLDRLLPGSFRQMSDGCCGQGGTFGLEHPELSQDIFRKRLIASERAHADIVVTTCSGCLLQWRAGTAGRAQGPIVLHLAELIGQNC
jgi:glycolate oxidase iron-sulfur subunit